MTENRGFRRRVRRQASGPGGSINVVADINYGVGDAGSASSQQEVRIVQRGGASAGNDTSGAAAEKEE